MANLLYVCEANLFRSPVAAQITREHVEDRNLHVSSGGLDDTSYSRMPSPMAQALGRLGYSPNGHTPRKVTNKELGQQDLILCFTKLQVRRILEISPELEGENILYTLPGYARHPDEEIVVPPEASRRVSRHRTTIYRSLGFVPRISRFHYTNDHGHYNERAIEACIKTVKQIERYVNIAIKRMVDEGLIPEPTP